MISGGGLPVPNRAAVAIVGAGPAGLGVARVLRDLAIGDVWMLERGGIGQSFLRWMLVELLHLTALKQVLLARRMKVFT